jgi:hypothetical protein
MIVMPGVWRGEAIRCALLQIWGLVHGDVFVYGMPLIYGEKVADRQMGSALFDAVPFQIYIFSNECFELQHVCC